MSLILLMHTISETNNGEIKVALRKKTTNTRSLINILVLGFCFMDNSQ